MIAFGVVAAGGAVVIVILGWSLCRAAAEADRSMAAVQPDALADASSAAIWAELDHLEGSA